MTLDSGPSVDPAPEGLATKALRLVGRLELLLMLVTFIGVVGLVSVQVILRYLFDFGIVWAQEVSQLLMLVAYFFGTSYVYKARQYLIIEFFFDRLPERWRLILYLATQALTVAFCTMLLVELIGIAPGQLRMKTHILHLPRLYSSLPLAIASASMAATAVYYGVRVALAARPGSTGRTLAEIEDAISLFPRDKVVSLS